MTPLSKPKGAKAEDFSAIDDFKLPASQRLEAAKALAKSCEPDMDAVCESDLHCHSFMSDGYCSPAMRVFEAWRRGMKSLAVSDHDLFDGQEEALAAAELFGIDLVPAAEFYSSRPGVEIIAHFPDKSSFLATLRSGAFERTVEPIRKAKEKQLAGMMARVPDCFRKLGFKAEITPEDVDRFVRNGVSTKGDISVVMWQKHGPELRAAGIASDVKDFQARYTTRDEMLNLPLELDMDLSPEAFVKRVRAWGGLPGFAHPTELRKKEGLGNAALRELVESLAAVGLQSVEVDGWRNGVCPETGIPQTELFDSLRLEWNARHPGELPLLFTNGSDDHNQPGEGLELGCGRDRNLRPEFGRYENVLALRERQALLARR